MGKLTVNDFSGGLTDSPFSSPGNCAEIADNVLIRKDKSLETCPGIEIFSNTAYRVSTNTRIQAMAKIDDGEWIAFSGKKLFHVTSAGITEVVGPVDSHDAFNLGSADSIVTISKQNNQFICTNDSRAYPIKVWKDGSNVVQLVTAGLPTPVITGVTATPSASASKAYLYGFAWSFEYTVGTVKHLDVGPIAIKEITNGPNYEIGSMTLGSLPVLANGADYNYDTANVKLKIFRSVENGSTLYEIATRDNGTASQFDAFDDVEVERLPPAYTSGGIRDNDAPPPSKIAFEANNTVFYADYLDGTEEKPNRVIQAITSDPDSVPSDFFTPFADTVKGGGSIGRNPIVFTEKNTIRLDGLIDELGRGSSLPAVLSSTIGCVAHNSIVKTSKGLYFASENGFHFTDGSGAPVLLARKDNFSSKIDNIYKNLVSTTQKKSRVQGEYNPNNHRVFWLMQEDESDCDSIYVYDETHDSFTVIRPGSGILPTAIALDGDDLILGDASGYLFRLTSSAYTVPVVNAAITPDNWNTATIMHKWKSIQHTFGDGSVNKWISKVNVQGNPETNLDLVINSYTNGEGEYKELYPLEVSPSLTWGDASFAWGDASFVWNRTSTMNQTRRFPAGRLRARHRAIEFTNAYIELGSSTSSADSRLTINASAGTATLVTPSVYSFGANNEGYNLKINGVEYEVLSGTEDTLTVDDPGSTLVDGTYDWSLHGYEKGQRLHLLNYSIEFEPLTDTGTYVKAANDA